MTHIDSLDTGTIIKEEFWRQYTQCRFAYNYNAMKRNAYKRTYFAITFMMSIITALSAVGWGIMDKYATIWAAIIFVSQLVNALKDQLSLSERTWALNQYLKSIVKDLSKFVNEWRQIMQGNLSENDIRVILEEHEALWSGNEADYLLKFDFIDSKRLIDKANRRTNAEIIAMHGAGEV